MIKLTIPAALVVLGAAVLGGCEEYYNVNDACVDNIVGAKQLTPIEEAALLRVNCYRRMAGVTRLAANPLVQVAARGTIGYTQQNPSVGALRSPLGAYSWLQQVADTPGFTGSNLYERLTGDPVTGGAGYSLSNVGSTGTREFIAIQYAQDPSLLMSGKQAIDELMRNPEFRQTALQPSVLDTAYAEGELSSDWFVEGGWFIGDANLDPSAAPVGRVFYLVMLFDEPHIEHAATPVLLPKEDQTGVPLYAWSTNQNIVTELGQYAVTQTSYPVTLLVGALNPENFTDVDQNQYSAFIEAAAITGPNGVLPTQVVHPGDDAVDAWPNAANMRNTLSIYTRRPFEPNTEYRVQADLTMPEGKFRVDYKFRTAQDDPGVDPTLGLSGDTTALGRRDSRGDEAFREGAPPKSRWVHASSYTPASSNTAAGNTAPPVKASP
jgi:hypothetical protein